MYMASEKLPDGTLKAISIIHRKSHQQVYIEHQAGHLLAQQ